MFSSGKKRRGSGSLKARVNKKRKVAARLEMKAKLKAEDKQLTEKIARLRNKL